MWLFLSANIHISFPCFYFFLFNTLLSTCCVFYLFILFIGWLFHYIWKSIRAKVFLIIFIIVFPMPRNGVSYNNYSIHVSWMQESTMWTRVVMCKNVSCWLNILLEAHSSIYWPLKFSPLFFDILCCIFSWNQRCQNKAWI